MWQRHGLEIDAQPKALGLLRGPQLWTGAERLSVEVKNPVTGAPTAAAFVKNPFGLSTKVTSPVNW